MDNENSLLPAISYNQFMQMSFFVIIESGKDVCRLYLMKLGHDSPSCGFTEYSACRTLWRTLQSVQNYKKQHNIALDALHIITDDDMQFNQGIMVPLLVISTFPCFH